MGTLSDFADLQVSALERSSYFQKVITSIKVQKVDFGNKCIKSPLVYNNSMLEFSLPQRSLSISKPLKLKILVKKISEKTMM